jgi:GntR family carbon starvation induced transcriptional regulator
MARSKTEAVYGDLREDLLNGIYPPGAKLAIEPLSRRFGSSPSAVREALARLTSDRLVEALPQRGFTVARATLEDLRDLTRVRIEIETRCLMRSVMLGTVEWEARLLASWHRLAQLERTAPGWERAHARFHDDLVSACDSPWWLNLRDSLFLQAERYRRMLLPRSGQLRDVAAEHAGILTCAMARDAQGSAAAMAAHLGRTAQHLEAAGVLRLERGDGRDGHGDTGDPAGSGDLASLGGGGWRG